MALKSNKLYNISNYILNGKLQVSIDLFRYLLCYLGLTMVVEVDLEVEVVKVDHLVKVLDSLDGICQNCQCLRNSFTKNILQLQIDRRYVMLFSQYWKSKLISVVAKLI